MRKTGPSNIQLRELIVSLEKNKKAKLWKRVSKELKKSSRLRRSANIYKIDRFTRDGETALVPGNVLSMGELTKNITVAAWKFSAVAKEKINKKGKAISIEDLLKKNPEGKKVRIIG